MYAINWITLFLELHCLDDSAELTPLGRILAKLPLDPRLGKMVKLSISKMHVFRPYRRTFTFYFLKYAASFGGCI